MKKVSLLLLIISLVFSPLVAEGASLDSLEEQIEELEESIKVNEDKVEVREEKADGLEKDINILNKDISKTTSRIKQTDLLIEKIGIEIEDKSASIDRLDSRIDFSRETIAAQLRFINRSNHISLFERLLTEDNLSRVFDSLHGLEIVQDKLHDNLETVRATKQAQEEERGELEGKQDEEDDYRRLQANQKQTLQSKKNVKNKVLKDTNTEKIAYQSLVDGTREEIVNIRERIRLIQSGGKELSFEEAMDLAQLAESKTGVRAALLMSVLYQESKFNANVGSCHYKTAIRSHTESWRKRQREAFEQITKSVGKSADSTLVSCPIKNSKGNYIGSGGAMGPAQFLPTTWLAYSDEVRDILGHAPDPWNVRDSIMAMAVFLKANGALKDERRAAGAYFGKCKFGYVSYCDSVLNRASDYQKEIDRVS